MKTYFFYLAILIGSFFSCSPHPKEIVVYHQFERNSWHRFEKLLFNIPIHEPNKVYDIYFFARHSTNYKFENLDFGMIMNTPSGEERINQYSFKIKKTTGGFYSKCSKDTCSAEMAIKRGLLFPKKGILKIEIETLVPRLEIDELFGVGIRIIPRS
jgi:gliding motility-associated lipoprotein GldH